MLAQLLHRFPAVLFWIDQLQRSSCGDLPSNTIRVFAGGKCQFGLPGGIVSPDTFLS